MRIYQRQLTHMNTHFPAYIFQSEARPERVPLGAFSAFDIIWRARGSRVEKRPPSREGIKSGYSRDSIGATWLSHSHTLSEWVRARSSARQHNRPIAETNNGAAPFTCSHANWRTVCKCLGARQSQTRGRTSSGVQLRRPNERERERVTSRAKETS